MAAVPVDLEAGTGAGWHVAVLVEVVAVGGRAGGLEKIWLSRRASIDSK
jgi:hypothetical protein